MKALLAQLCPRTPRMSKIQFILHLLLIGLMILFHIIIVLRKYSNVQPKSILSAANNLYEKGKLKLTEHRLYRTYLEKICPFPTETKKAI